MTAYSLFCLVLGHRWHVSAWSQRTLTLGHLHPLAGCRAVCGRCGRVWDDIPGDYVKVER